MARIASIILASISSSTNLLDLRSKTWLSPQSVHSNLLKRNIYSYLRCNKSDVVTKMIMKFKSNVMQIIEWSSKFTHSEGTHCGEKADGVMTLNKTINQSKRIFEHRHAKHTRMWPALALPMSYVEWLAHSLILNIHLESNWHPFSKEQS